MMKTTPAMAKHIVDVVPRNGEKVTHFEGATGITLAVSPNSIVLVHASSGAVLRYERHGNDLLIYLEDGSVIECRDYFASEDNRLAFESQTAEFEQIIFTTDAPDSTAEILTLQPEKETIRGLAPLMETEHNGIDPMWLWTGLGLLAGGAIGAVAGGGSSGGSGHSSDDHHEEPDNGGGSTQAALITINPIEHGGIINAELSLQPMTLNGTSDLAAGTSIVVTVNGKDYRCVAGADGSWCVTLSAADVSAISDGLCTVSVHAFDAQNSSTVVAQTGTSFVVDTCLPVITFKGIGDNILNAQELHQEQTLSGTVAGARPGDTLVLKLNGHTYQAVIQGDLSWKITLPAADLVALTDGSQSYTASVVNYCGNCGEGAGSFMIDTLAPSVAIDSITADNIINKNEHQQAQVISGTTSGAMAGDSIRVTIGDKVYTTTVEASGKWQVGVPAEDMQALAEGKITLSATVTDAAGNTRTATHDVQVDLMGPIITIDPMATDDIIDAIEKQEPLTISGSCGTDVTGVTLLIGGAVYTATVSGNSWSVTLSAAQTAALPSGDLIVVATATDSTENSTVSSRLLHVDSFMTPAISIDTFAGDNILNAFEAGESQVLSGQVFNAKAGDVVTVKIGAREYTTTVTESAQGMLVWNISIPSVDLSALAQGTQIIQATITNSSYVTAQSSLTVTVDTTRPTVTLNTVASDDIINATEHATAQIISGSSTNAPAGSLVTVNLNGKDYTTTTKADGTWSVGVPAKDITALADGMQAITVDIVNPVGNIGHGSHDITVDLTGPAITISTVSGDDVIDAVEKEQALTINGTCEAGTVTVRVIIAGISHDAVVDGTTWSLALNSGEISSLPAGDITIFAVATDAVGNSTNAIPHPVRVDNDTAPAIVIHPVATDNCINATEVASDLIITGQVLNASPGNTVEVTFNGTKYTTTVNADFTWSVTVPKADLSSLTEGSTVSVSAKVTASNGTTGQSQPCDVTVDISSPVITIDKFASDDVINSAEHGVAQIISGSATGATTGAIVTVTLNGKTYTTTLDANGNWRVGVPVTDIALLTEGAATITARVSDVAGNSGSATHNISSDLTGPLLTVSTVALDDIVNAAEKGADLTLSGTCGTDVASISVMLNGKDYTATVSNGSWSVTVPAADVAKLPEGSLALTATATDAAGNSTTATHAFSVDSRSPAITIDALGDNILNAADVTADQTLSGHVTGAVESDSVTVTLNGKTYTTTVAADLSWAITVPAADLAALGNGTATISAEVTTASGNQGSASHNITVDVSAPAVTIDNVTTDDILNSSEHDVAQIISGTATGVSAGTPVTVTLNGKTYTTTTGADGRWSVGVPAADVTALAEGAATITARVSDVAGNSGSATHNISSDLTGPALTVSTVALDDIVNAAEKGADLTLSGTCGTDVASISVMLNGKDYTATVSNGSWSVTVPAADVAKLPEGSLALTATATDAAGNSTTATHAFSVDSRSPAITIDALGDDMLNAADVTADQTLSGHVTGAAEGDSVTVTLNGKTYTTTVAADLSWAITVPAADLAALGNGTATISAEVTTASGNQGSASHNITVDVSAPAVTIDNVTTDDILNSSEHGVAQIISGTATGVSAGTPVTVTLNGKTYTTTTGADGRWSVGVPAADIALLTEGAATITARVSDVAGNSGSATHNISSDLTGPALTVSTVALDDIVNAAEKGADLTLSGTCGTDVASISVMLNGKEYTATAVDGGWIISIPRVDVTKLPEGDLTVSVVATDAAGNSTTATHAFSVDSRSPAITIDALGDDMLNAVDVTADQTLSGHVTGAVEGDSVTVTLNGKTYTTTVAADLSWAITVPAADLAALGNGTATVSAEVTTASGNQGTSTHSITVDTTAPVVTIEAVTADNIINDAEHGAAQIISGTASGVNTGATVTVSLNGHTYSATVEAGGTWSIGVPEADIAGLTDGSVTIKADVFDSAGNKGSTTHDFTVELTGPALTINAVAVDDIVNAVEKGADLVLSGTCGSDVASVKVTLNGKVYTATAISGAWVLTVPAEDVAKLPEGGVNVTVTAIDTIGNITTVSHAFSVDSHIPSISFNALGDDMLNAVEVAADQTLSGHVTGAAEGDSVTVTLNGKTYTATVAADLSWTVTVPAADLAVLGNGTATISAEVTTASGNKGSATHDITVDVSVPVVTIDPITADNVINGAEHSNAQIISGTASDVSAGAVVTVTLNGKTYTAITDANGKWSIGVPAADIAALETGMATVKAEVGDTAGNKGSATHDFTIDLVGSALTINTVAVDDIVNATEKGEDLVLSGSCDASATSVKVTLNGKEYTATVTGGTWSLTVLAADVSALTEGVNTISASASDNAGNTTAASKSVTVDSTAPVVVISAVATDDIFNNIEHGTAQTISGFAAGVSAGTTVTVTLNGKTYTTTTNTNGTWSIDVPAIDMAAIAEGTTTITAQIVDIAGNTGSATRDVITDITGPAITINTVAGDDIVDIEEKKGTLTISGTCSTDAEFITVVIDGKTYNATIDGTTWSVELNTAQTEALPAGDLTILVKAMDGIGNSTTDTHVIHIDGDMDPVILIDSVTVDNRLNQAEVAVNQEITGKATMASAGDTVVVTLNGKTYNATVASDLTWKVTVPAADLAALGEGAATVTAELMLDGNVISSCTQSFTVDTIGPVLTINPVATDDIINSAEHGMTQIISGTAAGASAGATVTVTLNGKTYTAAVTAEGNWLISVPTSDVAALNSGTVTIKAEVADAAGNKGSVTHDVVIDVTGPTLAIDTVTADDIVNSAEKNAALSLSGTCGTDVTAVTIILNGKEYTAIVTGATWSVEIPAADVKALPVGNLNVTATAIDTAGNSTTANHSFTVDNQASIITIDALGDDVLNAAEVAVAQNISGKVMGAAEGDSVVVTLNGKTYTTTVKSDLTWTVTVAATDLTALAQGQATITAEVTNASGNRGNSSHTVLVDTLAPVVTMNTVATDDIINIAEHNVAQMISGTATGVNAGATVTVTLNGHAWTTTVGSDGTWSMTVPAADIAALAAGTATFKAEVTDAAGNKGSTTRDVTVHLSAPALDINTIADDDIINAVEKGTALVLSGTCGEDVTHINVVLNGKEYTATVLDGSWVLTIPAVDVAKLPEGSQVVTASTTDESGNTTTAIHNFNVDSHLPTITINALGDDMLSAAEVAENQTISGKVIDAAVGDTVEVTLNGKTYTTTVAVDLSWTVTVPAEDLSALTQGQTAIVATVTSSDGNSGSVTRNIIVDTAAPVVSIDAVTGDDIINSSEHGTTQIISGTATGVSAGSVVTVTLNGKSYITATDGSGHWRVGIPAEDIYRLDDGIATFKAEITDSAGNKGSVSRDVTVNLADPIITINTVAEDDIVNSTEKGADLMFSGNCGLNVTHVKVTLNGKEYTATVVDNNWVLTIPAADVALLPEGNLSVAVIAIDNSGNSTLISHNFIVDSQSPVVTINPLGDDILNVSEVAAEQTLSGTVTGADEGDIVTVILNGKTYTTTVKADLTWSVKVPAVDLAALGEGNVTITAEVTAANGNKGSATHDITVDMTVPTVTIDSVTADNVINGAEHATAQIITGTSTGVSAGATVTVTLNGKTYTTTTDVNGKWSVGVPASDIAALEDGSATIKAEISDSAGNKGTVTHDFTLDLTGPTLTVDKVAGDDIVNIAEKSGSLAITGTSDLEGGTITVVLNGKTYTAIVSDGKWNITLAAAEVQTLAQGEITFTASVSDSSGNTTSVPHTFAIDTTVPTVIINAVCVDNIITANELNSNPSITGSVIGAKPGDIVTVHIGAHDYMATVNSDLSWSVVVQSADLKALGNGLSTITAEVTNAQGNTGKGERDINIDANLSEIYINPVSGDDVVNFIEHSGNIYITGSSSGFAPGAILTIEINGKTYQAEVKAGGLWQANVLSADVALWDGTETIKISGDDVNGNTITKLHDFTINTSLPAITVDPITADDVINADEQSQSLIISGSTAGMEEGQLVTITFANKMYTATVDANGHWETTVTATDMAALQNGLITVQVHVTNTNGESASAARAVLVDQDVPVIVITSMAGGDNVINAEESTKSVVISGVAGVPTGTSIEITLNGKSYTTVVETGGTWSVTLPGTDVTGLTNSDYTVTASVTDRYGNKGSTEEVLNIDVTLPTVKFDDPITDDNVINNAEHNSAILITGTSTNSDIGDTVVVKIGTKTYTTQVDENGNWSIGVPASVVKTLPEGENTFFVTITDSVGNSSNDSKVINVITALPTITMDTVALDNIINAQEAGTALTLSGTSNAADGAQVVVNFGTKSYIATVNSGVWSLTVSSADLQLLSNGNYAITASVTDQYHNGQSTTHNVTVDTRVPVITFNSFAVDDIVDAAEAATAQVLSGHVTNAQPGEKVIIHFGSHTYETVVKSDLSWSINISAADVQSLGDGKTTITAEITTDSGNHAQTRHDITVDANLPTLIVNEVSGDDIINVIEHDAPVVITGSSKNVESGAIVTITVNGIEHEAVVKTDGTWQVGFTKEEVSAWPAGELDVKASVNNGMGNATITVNPVQVNLNGPAISIDAIATDNIINAVEKSVSLIITGKTLGVEANCTVMLKLGGKNYTAKVNADGTWSIQIPSADMATLPNGTLDATAIVLNKAGNKAECSQGVLVDSISSVLTIDTIAQDNIINRAEHADSVQISGFSDAGEGKKVQVTLNGKTYDTLIDSDGKWSVIVSVSDVNTLTDGTKSVVVSVSDDAGNQTTKTVNILVDLTEPTLSFDSKQAIDNVINATEHEQAQVITGTSTGLAEGATVVVKITNANGVIKSFTTAVDVEGKWSIGISADIVRGLADGTYTLTADAKDSSGNPASQATHDIDVKTISPELSITTTSAGNDNILNKTEKADGFSISGDANLPDGSILTVTFNGKIYHPEISGGHWVINISPADIASVNDGSYIIYAQAKDVNGNITTISKNIIVDTVAPIAIINVVAGDDIVNSAEAETGQIINGKVINGVAGDIVKVTLGSKTYTTTVGSDLTWSVTAPAEDLKALNNGANTINVIVVDGAGNESVNYPHEIGIAIKMPELTIDDISGDKVINKIEHGQPLIITGSATNLSSGDVVQIIISDGITSKTYSGTVGADGHTWVVLVPKDDVAAWGDNTDLTFTATATDAYGNKSAEITTTATVNLDSVAISLDSVAGDNIINEAEASNENGLVLSGQTSNAKDGDTVTVTFAGKTYTTVVSNPENDESGTWTLTIPKEDLEGLTIGNNNEVKVRVTNDLGISAEEHRFITYEPVPPTITISVISGDNILSASEMGQPLQIKGTSSSDTLGQTLTVTFNGKTYTTIVTSDGSWSVSVPASDLTNMQNGLYDVKAEVNDLAGNHGTMLADPPLQVSLKVPQIVIDPITGDNFINAAEHSSSTNLAITGTTIDAEPGATVRVTLGGVNYNTTVKADGSWSLIINAAVIQGLAEGTVLVDAMVQDSHGNSGYAPQVKVTVDTIAPVISIDTVATDNILNTDELTALNGQTISGTASVSEAGRTLYVVISGNGVNQSYTAVVGVDGKWCINIPTGELADFTNGNYDITATLKDAAGNEETKTKKIRVDDTKPVITIDLFSGDDRINNSEYTKSQIISGTTDAAAGRTVTVIFGDGTANAKTYTTTVSSDGKWSVTIGAEDMALLSDGSYVIKASVDNVIGNHGSSTRPIVIDATPPVIAFDTNIAGQDNVVNITEQVDGIRVSGTTTADPGQTVTVTFNNSSNYSATVAADGSWYVDLSGNDFTALADGDYTVTAVVTDKAGNTSSTASKTITLSDEKFTLTIDDFTGDVWLNNAEASTVQKVTGTSSASDGTVVTITINNKTYTTVVLSGKWSCDVSVADLSLFTDGAQYAIEASISNTIGNVTNASKHFTVDKSVPTSLISVDSITDDSGLSSNDFITNDRSLTIKGSLDKALGVNEKAQISIDGGMTWTSLNVTGTDWSYIDGRSLSEGKQIYQVRVIDEAGNIGNTVSRDVVIDTTKPSEAITLTIDSITTDSGISGSDFITNDTMLTIKGKIGAALGNGEHVQISLDNGITWSNVSLNGLDWTYDCGELTGTVACKVRVIDDAGNIGSTASRDIVIDTTISDTVVAITSISDDTGTLGDSKTNDTTLTINGSLNQALLVDEMVQISVDGGAWKTVMVTGTSWQYADSTVLTEGSHSWSVRIIDKAGNIGSTAQKDVVIDTTLSGATIAVTSIDTDTGKSNVDFITANNTPTLKGSVSQVLAADERLEICIDDGTWQSVTLDGVNWSYATAVLADGEHTYSLRIIDDADNASTITTQKVVIDTVAPLAMPEIVSYTDNNGKKQGTFDSVISSDDKTPCLNGTLTKALGSGEVVEIYRNGVVVGQAAVTGLTWTWTDNLTSLSDGTYTYSAKVVDVAGNSSASSNFDYVLNTVLPTLTAVMSAFTTTDTTPVLSGTFNGTGDFLSTYILEVTVNGKTYSSADGSVVIDILNKTWYLQIPDQNILTVSGTAYSVNMQVSTLTGNGGDITNSAVTIGAETAMVGPAINSENYNPALAGGVTLDANGMWMFTANDTLSASIDRNTYTKTVLPITGYYNASSFLDYNRDGYMDIVAESTGYDNFYLYTNSGVNTFTRKDTRIGGGGIDGGDSGTIVTADFNGDGYADFIFGDNNLNSSAYFINSKDGSFAQKLSRSSATGVTKGKTVSGWISGAELSIVDLNNDGKSDVVMHTTNNSNNYELSSMLGNGDGTFIWQQEIANAFYSTSDSNYNTSLTWADFNNDGYMDLYMSMWRNNGFNGKLLLNDGSGNLNEPTAVDSEGVRSGYSLAIDWNHDGYMDIVKTGNAGWNSNYKSYIYLNDGTAKFTKQVFGTRINSVVTAVATMDFDWDGSKDVLISYQNGQTELVRNTNVVDNGSSLHFKIVDQNGINCYFGNTVNLYDSKGKRVASQILNTQSGMGVNDSSAIVDFYGLNSRETYRVELVYQENGISKTMTDSINVAWGGLKAGVANENICLSVESDSAMNNGKFVGTGYNDTFTATTGTDVYDGSGGWTTASQHNTWSSTGGVDTIDFAQATTGVTVDLSKTGAQSTGFNTITLKNIEGIAGSAFNDTLTGNAGDNVFEGRGGNDTINLGNSGHDTLLYKLISNTSDGGVGHDVINGFKVGTWEGTENTSRIDISDLLKDSGYTGTASAHYVNNVAKLDNPADDIDKFVHVVQNGENVDIQIDRDGTGETNDFQTVATLDNTHTDLLTLLANHQLIVV
ncbi:Ig-like domain-containing protein [Citrobacter sp. Awk 4]|uniref:Ig-like domain-containing protein n=1 Tax=Citrobacter sp. Awk 4 TaxID=2963955 RepID=UPI00230254F2|nr:Ig-like domain-containing protein [Citrobacter sp. Awk 4]MDA8478312.1 Ig-like domain-containing protein [Citrobacter sp. Awk 4]